MPGPPAALATLVPACAFLLVAVHAWRALGPARAAGELLALAVYLVLASAGHIPSFDLATAVAVVVASMSLAARLWWLSPIGRSLSAALLAASTASALAPLVARGGGFISFPGPDAIAAPDVATAADALVLVFAWTFAAEAGRGSGWRPAALRAVIALGGLAVAAALSWTWPRLDADMAPVPAVAWTVWAVLWGVPAVLALTGRAALLPESVPGLLGSAGSRLPAAALMLTLGAALVGAAALRDPRPAITAAGPLLPALALLSAHPPLDRWRGRAFARLARVQDFAAVLMKPRNGMPWTAADRAFLRAGVRTLARWAPGFVLFLLPGGLALLGLYAWLLDRRRGRAASTTVAARRKTDAAA